MPKEVSLKQGLDAIVAAAVTAKERPFLIALYGHIDAGKSYAISALKWRFAKRGLDAGGETGGPSASTFELLCENPETYGDIHIFHCCWNRKARICDNEDPNILAAKIARRKVNLNIGIYNPRMCQAPTGTYDFIISNPLSQHKKTRS
ncbi:hypothetical protein HY642_07085 [Candidatus Woesearchaeota archaeon]|nr:hypothetical protein [Candidatus Woesearchaeota archaeon]